MRGQKRHSDSTLYSSTTAERSITEHNMTRNNHMSLLFTKEHQAVQPSESHHHFEVHHFVHHEANLMVRGGQRHGRDGGNLSVGVTLDVICANLWTTKRERERERVHEMEKVKIQNATSYYTTSYYITSHHIISHRITLYHIPLHHITSHHITSCPTTSSLKNNNDNNNKRRHITSHYITSYFLSTSCKRGGNKHIFITVEDNRTLFSFQKVFSCQKCM